MLGFLIMLCVGMACILLGSAIRHGRIDLLHDYHIVHISEAEKARFCSRVGFGVLLLGYTVFLSGGMLAACLLWETKALLWIALALLGVGIVTSIAMIVFAFLQCRKGA